MEGSITRLTESEESEEVTGYQADIKVHCMDCFKPFVFIGLPAGASFSQPMVSADGTELRAPIVPIS